MRADTESDQEPTANDPAIVAGDAQLETLWEEGGFTEGAAVSPTGKIYFSDFGQPFDARPARIMKFDPATKKTSVHSADSKMANGLMFDRRGRVIACCASPIGGARALVQVGNDGSIKTLVGQFEGKRFNSPNDLVIDRQGRIYFSDPRYLGHEPIDQPVEGVYRLDPDGSIDRIISDAGKPNGVCVAPDQKSIYVVSNANGKTDILRIEDDASVHKGRMALLAYDLHTDGTATFREVLVDYAPQDGPDGLVADVDGNLYVAVRDATRPGIVVYSPEGSELAYIPTPEKPTNVAFGHGAQSKILYVTYGPWPSKEGDTGAGGENPHVLAKIKVEKDGSHLPAK